MADSIDVKMVGVEDVVRNIKALAIASPMAVQKGTLRVALKIERQAKANVPVDTGRLRASISTNWTGSGKNRGDVESKAKAEDGVGQPQESLDTFKAVIGTNVEYAPHVEFDETAHHEVGGPHFLYASYFAYENDVEKEISSELGKELVKAMKK